MTEVAFHFNVPDRLGYACRLLRKAYATGGRTVVVGSAEQIHALDTALWTFSALDFIPHARASAPPETLAHTPVVLATDAQEVEGAQIMVHLGETVPAGFERFERLIELVGTDQAGRAHARQRWRHYADRGYEIKRHDAAAKE
ncbi:DNA polymerase III subunit chi [Ottowia sp. GY511]|uniref:DNA polymerase III subunit chi n=1 Tax=Ottowia flava TaxID=2675430 RepID=A0ABW4KW49_9BURK|nr:DNA polymerase III subunit chi [Ottowia sp. GY511]TXK24959.1 DNA polymerase III subunit chi [Ottowia sp. GY511]